MTLTIGKDLLFASLVPSRSFLAGFILLLLATLGMGVAWRREVAWKLPKRVRQQAGWRAGLTILIFGILNWGLLAALPWLGLSFGSLGFSLFCLTLLSGLILLVAGTAYKLGVRFGRFESTPERLKSYLRSAWLAQGVIYLLAVYALYWEPFNLQTTHFTISGPQFFPGRPVRILQISDLHVERQTRRELAVLERVRGLQPDLIVLTGDYLNLDYLADPLSLRDARLFLSQLEARYGVYAVSGTVDYPAMMKALFTDLPITVLDDQVRTIHLPNADLDILGVSYRQGVRDAQALARLSEQVPQDDFSLLLYHTPDLAETADDVGIDLYLAGHTHGGQVRLPFYGALTTLSVYGKRFEAGSYILEHTQMYVSRGLGMEGMGLPRVRFLCPPELVLVEIGVDLP